MTPLRFDKVARLIYEWVKERQGGLLITEAVRWGTIRGHSEVNRVG